VRFVPPNDFRVTNQFVSPALECRWRFRQPSLPPRKFRADICLVEPNLPMLKTVLVESFFRPHFKGAAAGFKHFDAIRLTVSSGQIQTLPSLSFSC